MKQKNPNQTLESIAVRRAKVADADKVRYRVYSTPTEFIAVIAESALMAVKVSGVAKPHKIIRDLPTEGIAIEAKKMASVQDTQERISIAIAPKAAPRQMKTELAPAKEAAQVKFEPMGLGDLRNKGETRARILSPDLISALIDEHAKMATSAPAATPVETPAAPVAPVEEMAPVQETSPAAEQAAPVELSPEEKIAQLADEVLPPGDAKPKEEVLSPEEVEKLLNG